MYAKDSVVFLQICMIKVFFQFFTMFKLQKRIKIGRRRAYHYFGSIRRYEAPVFTISGLWFRSFGFRSGDYVQVIARKDEITLKPIKL